MTTKMQYETIAVICLLLALVAITVAAALVSWLLVWIWLAVCLLALSCVAVDLSKHPNVQSKDNKKGDPNQVA